MKKFLLPRVSYSKKRVFIGSKNHGMITPKNKYKLTNL